MEINKTTMNKLFNAVFSFRYLAVLAVVGPFFSPALMLLLAVAFLEFMLASGMGTLNWTVLVVPFTIIALAIGLKWMQAGSEELDLIASQPESLPVKESYLEE